MIGEEHKILVEFCRESHSTSLTRPDGNTLVSEGMIELARYVSGVDVIFLAILGNGKIAQAIEAQRIG